MKTKLIVLVLLLAILVSALSSSTYAAETSKAAEKNGDSGDSVGILAYSSAPTNINPFIYNGRHPGTTVEVDTVDCNLNVLYVYDSEAKSFSQISDSTVIAYTATKDGIFFITESGQIVYSDYQGVIQENVGTVHGSVASFDYFDGSLFYVEDGNRIVFVDVQTGVRNVAFTADCIISVYQFDHDKLIWRDTNDVPFYLNTTTGENTALESEMEVNSLMASYITPTVSAAGTNTRTTSGTAVNDVTFPLAEYPVPTSGTNYSYNTAVSYFNSTNKNVATCNHNSGVYGCKYYGGHSQCFGFAIYAHDCYLHILDTTKTSEGWVAGDFVQCARIVNGAAVIDNQDYVFEDESDVREFFQKLGPGAYVRYGKTNDSTPSNGVHSIVVVSIEENGFWAYECNQDNKCGVHLWYYTYSYLHSRYNYIYNYVNHTFGEMEYENTSTHKNGCVHCDGYLRQPHTKISDPMFYDETKHRINYRCCEGFADEEHTDVSATECDDKRTHSTTYNCCEYTLTEPHTDSGQYKYLTNYLHRITFSCCGTYVEGHTDRTGPACFTALKHKTSYNCCGQTVAENHTEAAQYSHYSQDMHKISFSCCSGYMVREHTFTSGPSPVCTGCGKPKIEGLCKNTVVVSAEFIEAQGE